MSVTCHHFVSHWPVAQVFVPPCRSVLQCTAVWMMDIAGIVVVSIWAARAVELGLLRLQAGGAKRRQNLVLVFLCLFCVIVLLCSWRMFAFVMLDLVSAVVDQEIAVVCRVTRSNVKIKVTGPLKFQNCTFQGPSPPPFTMGTGKWPPILKLRNNIYIWSGQIFYICHSFCVTWAWTWRKIMCPVKI